VVQLISSHRVQAVPIYSSVSHSVIDLTDTLTCRSSICHSSVTVISLLLATTIAE